MSKWRNEINTPVYRIWVAMHHRCYHDCDSRYRDYGGRGITVCERWHDFDNFHDDMGPRPEGYTLERKDNDGNYELANCCWASQSDQARNRCSTHMVTHNGETLPMIVWAERTGIPLKTLWARIAVYGMSPSRALSGRDLRNSR